MKRIPEKIIPGFRSSGIWTPNFTLIINRMNVKPKRWTNNQVTGTKTMNKFRYKIISCILNKPQPLYNTRKRRITLYENIRIVNRDKLKIIY